MKLLGIDQATTTGICRVFVDDAGVEHYEVGHVAPPPEEALGAARLAFYERWIRTELRCGIDRVIVESPSTVQRGNVLAQIGILAVIELEAYKREIPVTYVHSSTLKKWATGRGDADKGTTKAQDKPMMRAAALNEHGLKCTGDEADALFLAHIGFYLATGRNVFEAYRQEALNLLRHGRTKKPKSPRKRTTKAAKEAA